MFVALSSGGGSMSSAGTATRVTVECSGGVEIGAATLAGEAEAEEAATGAAAVAGAAEPAAAGACACAADAAGCVGGAVFGCCPSSYIFLPLAFASLVSPLIHCVSASLVAASKFIE